MTVGVESPYPVGVRYLGSCNLLLLQHQSQLGVYAKSKECQPGVDPYSRLKYQLFLETQAAILKAFQSSGPKWYLQLTCRGAIHKAQALVQPITEAALPVTLISDLGIRPVKWASISRTAHYCEVMEAAIVGSDTFGRVQSGIPTQRRGPRPCYGSQP